MRTGGIAVGRRLQRNFGSIQNAHKAKNGLRLRFQAEGVSTISSLLVFLGWAYLTLTHTGSEADHIKFVEGFLFQYEHVSCRDKSMIYSEEVVSAITFFVFGSKSS